MRHRTVIIAVVWALLVPMTAQASDADGVRAQAMAVRGESFLVSILGAQIPRRPLLGGDKEAMDRCGADVAPEAAPVGCDAIAYAAAIVVRPGLVGRLARLAHPRGLRGADAFAAQVLLHEQLHTERDARPLDEGTVDALAADLTPAFLRTIGAPAPDFGWVPIHYDAEVAVVRKASGLATGTSWRSVASRHWRRDLWRLTSSERDAAVTEALR